MRLYETLHYKQISRRMNKQKYILSSYPPRKKIQKGPTKFKHTYSSGMQIQTKRIGREGQEIALHTCVPPQRDHGIG